MLFQGKGFKKGRTTTNYLCIPKFSFLFFLWVFNRLSAWLCFRFITASTKIRSSLYENLDTPLSSRWSLIAKTSPWEAARWTTKKLDASYAVPFFILCLINFCQDCAVFSFSISLLLDSLLSINVISLYFFSTSFYCFTDHNSTKLMQRKVLF